MTLMEESKNEPACPQCDQPAGDKEIIRLWLRERRGATVPPPAPAELRLQLRRIATMHPITS